MVPLTLESVAQEVIASNSAEAHTPECPDGRDAVPAQPVTLRSPAHEEGTAT